MKKIKYILSCAAILATSLVWQPAEAQVNAVKDASFPVILAPHSQTASYLERTLCYDIDANVDYTVTTDADWISVRKTDKGTVYIHLKANPTSASREGNVIFSNEEHNLTETLVITQSRNEQIPTTDENDTQVKVATATANNNQSGYGIALTYDGNTSTFWHTSWGNNNFVVSESNPAILTYNFNGNPHIDYIKYITRPEGASGSSNGNFGKIEIYAKTGTNSDYTLVLSTDCGKTSGSHRISLGKEGLDNVKSIQIKVLSGYNDNASCAEMQFYVKNGVDYASYFTDESYSELREGVTEADIDNMDDEFIATLADSLYHNNYRKDYRVAEYTAKLSYSVQSDIWNAPGKYYDQRQGVTGINLTKGKHTIAVSGLPEGGSVPLIVTAWWVNKYGTNFDGGNPQSFSFSLSNGLNVIDYDYDYDGLAYVCYYADANPELQPKVKVHFINGQINGYLSHDKTNDEMHAMTANAPNRCIDVVGDKVHSVWEAAEGLHKYCKATDGTSLGYRQYINVLDSLVDWEHELLGFKKYNSLPDNRTMAYVNYTYYMFQGGFGVSFIHSQQWRVLNCKTLVYNDNDAIWGLSHEWGHQHQMHPYFCWAGMSEVTNNMNSYYNIMKMGYCESDKINNWASARKHFIQNDYSDIAPNYNSTKGSTDSNMRYLAYTNRGSMANSALAAIIAEMKDSTITSYSANPKRALAINEVGVGEILCPFIMLYDYFTTHGFPDFAQDWYEALRQTDQEGGSTIEKNDGFDKYELIAAAQNGNKNGLYSTLKAQYPNSCWVKKGYITASSTQWQNSVPYVMNYIRKVSRLTGYNLLPYFERWGFLRQVSLYIGDYGNKWMICNSEMYDEFKEDMDALGLKTVNSLMIKDISNTKDLNYKEGSTYHRTYEIPNFPN